MPIYSGRIHYWNRSEKMCSKWRRAPRQIEACLQKGPTSQRMCCIFDIPTSIGVYLLVITIDLQCKRCRRSTTLKHLWLTISKFTKVVTFTEETIYKRKHVRYVSKFTAASRGSPCDSTAFLSKWQEERSKLQVRHNRTRVLRMLTTWLDERLSWPDGAEYTKLWEINSLAATSRSRV